MHRIVAVPTTSALSELQLKTNSFRNFTQNPRPRTAPAANAQAAPPPPPAVVSRVTAPCRLPVPHVGSALWHATKPYPTPVYRVDVSLAGPQGLWQRTPSETHSKGVTEMPPNRLPQFPWHRIQVQGQHGTILRNWRAVLHIGH
jgi:hypothetical protein